MSGYSRGNPAMGDVVRSVLVLAAVVLAIWGIGRFFTVTPDQPTSEVDWRTAASGVEPRAGFVPWVPSRVPEDWRVTSARLVDTRWQMGVVTADSDFIGLDQQAGDVDDLVQDRAAGSEPDGEVNVDARTWKVRTGPESDTTYTIAADGQALLVRGDAPRADIEAFLALLGPYSDASSEASSR